MNPMAKVRAIAGGAAAVAVVCLIYAGWGTAPFWALPVLAAALTASELSAVELSFGRQRWTFSCAEGAIGAALVASTGGWAIVAAVLGVLMAELVLRVPRVKALFNVAQFGAATALGVGLSHYLGGGLMGATAGMGVFWLANSALVGGAVAATTGKSYWSLLWQSMPLSALHSSGNTSVGLLAAWLAFNAPLGLLGLVVPMGLLWYSYDQQTARAAEANLFAELARGQERVTGQSIDVSAQVVLTAAARLFGGADVELVLTGGDGPVRYRGDEYGVPERHRVDPTAFDEEWVIRVLAAGDIVTGVDDHRPYCSMVLGRDESPLAVIHARRPEGASKFGRREVMLAHVLVGQAEAWLSVADLTASRDAALAEVEAAGEVARALGDLGADTAANLVTLRESAGRLARLAAPSRVGDLDTRGVGEIVDELHSVERAVASLLGAIALAADTDLAFLGAGRSDVAAPRPAEAEWTTTGVLASESI